MLLIIPPAALIAAFVGIFLSFVANRHRSSRLERAGAWLLAVSWTYLVIAEIVASTNGIGAMMMRARRFLHTDEIMAGIVVIGVLGLMCDMLFRMAHRLLFPYIDESAR